jgi:hypothetical protein
MFAHKVSGKRGVVVMDGYWGYRLMVIVDPGGNKLYFNYTADSG